MQLEEESKQKLPNAHACECEKDVCVCVHACVYVALRQQASFLLQFRISLHRSPATFTLRWTPPHHHTPWGLLSWQMDRTAIMATSSYGVPCGLYTWRGQGAQQPLTPGLSGVGLASPPI